MTVDVTDLIRTLRGIARRAELLNRGAEPNEIRTAWREGRILRVRHGVYALPTTPTSILRAARLGGVLASHSACALNGLWVPRRFPLCVSVPQHASGLRDPDDACRRLDLTRRDVKVIYDGSTLDPWRDRPFVGVARCVVQVIRDSAPPMGLAVLDSAVRRCGMSDETRAWLLAELPARCHDIVALADRSAESGTESAMRWGLIRAGLKFEAQKWLTADIRVDFVVAGFVVVECVSYEHHGSPEDYEKDRTRIAEIARLGYVPLEFTYHQVFSGWDDVERTILAVVLRG